MNCPKTQPTALAPTALVTGAARRVGQAIAKALHEAGFRVAIHCHQSLSQAHQLANELNAIRNDSALVIQGDLSTTTAPEAIIQAVTQWADALHVLVNNASLFVPSELSTETSSGTPSGYELLYAVNVFAPWRLSLAARPWLTKTCGNIINITDIHAEKPLKGYAEYCQTKAALTMQTKALAREFAPHIRVNAIAPGAVVWPEAHNALSPQAKEKIIQATPLKKHGHPEYIAQAVLSLITNPFITGQILSVDGGRSIT
jgi:pteridine reductase